MNEFVRPVRVYWASSVCADCEPLPLFYRLFFVVVVEALLLILQILTQPFVNEYQDVLFAPLVYVYVCVWLCTYNLLLYMLFGTHFVAKETIVNTLMFWCMPLNKLFVWLRVIEWATVCNPHACHVRSSTRVAFLRQYLQIFRILMLSINPNNNWKLKRKILRTEFRFYIVENILIPSHLDHFYYLFSFQEFSLASSKISYPAYTIWDTCENTNFGTQNSYRFSENIVKRNGKIESVFFLSAISSKIL